MESNLMEDVKESIPSKSPKCHFQCGKCKKLLYTSQGLKRHMNVTHSNIRNFKCDICDKVFKHQSNLLTHKKTHTGQKFTCVSCEKTFSTRGNLKKHLKTHVSTLEELNKLWNDNYVTELSLKYGKRYEVEDEVKVELVEMEDQFSFSTLGLAMEESGIVIKNEEDYQTPMRHHVVNPNRRNLRMANMMTDVAGKFARGHIYPVEMANEEDSEFADENESVPDLCVYKCAGCAYMDTRGELCKHMKEVHGELFATTVCTLCMVKVPDLEKHKKVHESAVHSAFLNMSMWALGRSVLGADPEPETMYTEGSEIMNRLLNTVKESLERIQAETDEEAGSAESPEQEQEYEV